MADLQAAIGFVLRQEDGTLSGVITQTPDGRRTRFGIDEHFHPELASCLFYDSMGSIAALKIAEGIYAKQYCEPLCIAEISDQEIANKLLSLGVNCGVGTASRMLQEALEVHGDGRIGPITLDALDRTRPDLVLGRLRELAMEHYEELIQRNNGLAVYRAGWLKRAEA
ncbi:MAG TPA: putative peptidoglycan-binding domain-containing protein [Acidobacteriaceae bacterium]|jgi:lysozyme family protein